MLNYYLSLALRHALRNKLYSLISIVGLALGLSIVVMVGIYVDDELSYDRWIPESGSIYQVMPAVQDTRRVNVTPSDLGLWLRQDYTQLDEVTRVFRRPHLLAKDDVQINDFISWVDSNFFDVFALPVVAGNVESVLDDPANIVVTESIAERYFGSADGSEVIGETILMDRETSLRVAAVIADLPSNTHLRIGILGPGHALHSPMLEQDNNPLSRLFGTKMWGINTYVKAPSAAIVDAVEADLDDMLDRRLPIDQGRKNSDIYELTMMPIEGIHLAPTYVNEGERDLSGIFQVSTIAALTLIAACINYINLMTAHGMKRVPEIAIRKTVGASKQNLIRQHLSESLLYVSSSFLLAVLLSYLMLGPFNGFMNRNIQFDLFNKLPLLFTTVSIVLGTILLVGIYPALLLSRVSPMQGIKGGWTPSQLGRSKSLLRNVLSTVQFAIFTTLLIATTAIYQQSRFAIESALNQNTDPVIIVTSGCDETFRQQLLQMPEVHGASCSGQLPQWSLGASTSLRLMSGEDRTVSAVRYTNVDEEFFPLFDLGLAAGRNFDEGRSTDVIRDESQFETTTSIIVNEELVRQFEFASNEDALGQVFAWSRMFRYPSTFSPVHNVEIVGVLRDFQIGSVREASPPAAFFIQPDMPGGLSIRIDGNNVVRTLQQIDDAWLALNPDQPIRRVFFEETIEAIYRSITQQTIMLTVGAVIALSIAVLGLVGLAAFVSEKRSKEIGIRKVLGGSRFDIVRLLLSQFSRPVLISNLLAWPIAYYFLNRWLQSFASHIDLDPVVFVAASVLTLGVALFTVFAHSFRVASINPVSALRYE